MRGPRSYLTGGDDTITLRDNTLDIVYDVAGDTYRTYATVYGGDGADTLNGGPAR
ncbi:hypothetical protein ACFO5X_06470 [Seohaeicola nanhaiensis]|uniref:Haemolysin-type calcium binding-related domain-containing protein n=1 Tax=Seohaeicola nanhaiensis TaxID=1387282 RepID=A0ABV9KF21_9RHOB